MPFGAYVQTTTILRTFVLVMVRQPDIYCKLQQEMNKAVGHERLPDFDDRQSLPYLNAVIKELYRYAVLSTSLSGASRKMILLTVRIVQMASTCSARHPSHGHK